MVHLAVEPLQGLKLFRFWPVGEKLCHGGREVLLRLWKSELLVLEAPLHSGMDQHRGGRSITEQWGLKHKQLTLPEAEKHLATAMAELFPNWPKPKELKTLKWLYSQVHKSFPGSPGSVELSQSPPMLLGGDAFAPSSNFSGCLKSAQSLVEKLKSAF